MRFSIHFIEPIVNHNVKLLLDACIYLVSTVTHRLERVLELGKTSATQANFLSSGCISCSAHPSWCKDWDASQCSFDCCCAVPMYHGLAIHNPWCDAMLTAHKYF